MMNRRNMTIALVVAIGLAIYYASKAMKADDANGSSK
jgi:hypothetical protein